MERPEAPVFLTIAEIRRKRLWLEVRCVECHRISYLPHGLLPARLAADLPIHLAAAHFRCSCGSKQVTTLMADLDKLKPKPPGA